MIIYTIGFTQKTAQQFFTLINGSGAELLLDIRLNNTSQLAGFAKGADLAYFLPQLCGCAYKYGPVFAPTKELMDAGRGKKMASEEFSANYTALMNERGATKEFLALTKGYDSVCLLCSEPTADMCHRGVLAELLQKALPGTEVVHL